MSAQKNKTILGVTLAVVAVFLLGGVSFTYFPTEQPQQETLPSTHVLWTQPTASNLTVTTTDPPPNITDHQQSYWVLTRHVSMDTVCIGSDGSLNATDTPIHRSGDTYTLTGNIANQTIVVQKDNIVLDGAGYTLQGWSETIGDQATAISISNRNNITITDFNIKQFTVPIWMQNSTGIIVKNNNIIQGYPYALLMQSTNQSKVANNTFTGSMLQLEWSSSNHILNNTFSGSYTGVADYSSGNGNVITKNIFAAVNMSVVSQGANSTISQNTLVNGDVGLLVEGQNYDVSKNVIANYTTALSVISNNSLIRENDFWNSTIDIMLNFDSGSYKFETGNNTFYLNNFRNYSQTLQVLSPSNLTDHWDNGREGNYWSNYTGADGNGDGVGDTPYFLAQNSIDNFPLMQPYSAQSTNPEMGAYFFVIAALTALVGALAIATVYTVRRLR
jgi:nitrous oxidase accessory protein NosD